MFAEVFAHTGIGIGASGLDFSDTWDLVLGGLEVLARCLAFVLIRKRQEMACWRTGYVGCIPACIGFYRRPWAASLGCLNP